MNGHRNRQAPPRPVPSATLLPVCLLGLAVSCRAVLGINEAEVDPGVAGSGGSNGSDVNGGSDSGAASAGTAGSSNASDRGDGGGSGASSAGEAGGGGSDGEPAASTLCQTYCATVTANCSGVLAQYADLDTCLAVCSVLPEGGGPNDSGSNTVRCRLEQAQRISGDNAYYYCPQAGPSGGGQCGSGCDGYCAVMTAFCTSQSTDGRYYYSSLEACKQGCQQLPQDDLPYSTALHSTGPHLQCRLFHACAAFDAPISECAPAIGGYPCQLSN